MSNPEASSDPIAEFISLIIGSPLPVIVLGYLSLMIGGPLPVITLGYLSLMIGNPLTAYTVGFRSVMICLLVQLDLLVIHSQNRPGPEGGPAGFLCSYLLRESRNDVRCEE